MSSSVERTRRRRARGVTVGAGLTVLAVLGAACGPSPSTTPAPSRGVTIPSIPLPTPASFTISAASVEEIPCSACTRGETPDAARYFFGEVPLGSVDAQLAGTASDRRASVGNMFASGYFGGIYLRSALGGGSQEELAAQTPLRGLLDVIGSTTSAGVDSAAGALLSLAENGTDDEVKSAAALWSALLASIYGYNRGYLDVALQNPPSGSGIAPTSLACAQYFECRSSGLRSAAVDQLAAQRNALVAPTSLEWLFATTTLSQIVGSTVPAGQQVWNQILGGAGFDPASYRSIIDLSYGFLEVTEAALLANLAGAAGGDVDLARRGLTATASLVVWAGSYFLGLASPLSNRAQPTITCPV